MTGPYRVVLTDQVFPDIETERELLGAIGATVEVATGGPGEVAEQARDADALLNTYLPLRRDFIERLQRCRIIARYGIGVDNVDLAAARDAGIVVTNVPDYCVEEVATHTLALLLALLRRLPEADRLVRSGGWGMAALRPIPRLSELTVGLVGYGRIGRALAGSLRQLGFRLLVHDPYIDPATFTEAELVGLDELLASADAVSLHLPLTEESRGIIGQKELAQMREQAVLVNTSRGPLIVLEDLVDSLRAGRLRAAALDVFPEEPADGPGLADVPGLFMTPHMAYYSEAALRDLQRKAVTQVVKVLSGAEPDYPVRG